MQYFQFVATNATTGAVLPGATVSVYLTGTFTLASLYNASGSPISNPITASGTGAVGFAAVNGTYDIAAVSGAYTSPTIVGVQLYDLAHQFANNLMNYAGADPTGATSSSAAITAWLAASLASGAPLYAPKGTYLDGARTLDFAAVWGTGIRIYGDGPQQTIFNLNGGSWLIYSSGASGGAGALFYLTMEGMGFTSSVAAVGVVQLGDSAYTSALNGCSFRDIWVKNTSSSGSPSGLKLNEVYSSDFANCTVNAGGYSTTSGMAALRLTQASFNRFQGSFSASEYGVHLTSNAAGTAVGSMNATINGSGVMTVTGTVTYPGGMPAAGLVSLHMQGTSGTLLPNGTYVVSQLTGTLGQAGTYQLANSTGSTIPTVSSSTAMYAFTTGYSFGNVFENLDCEITSNAVQIDSTNAANNTFIGGEYNVGPLGAGPGNIVNALAGSSNIFLNLRSDLVANSTNLVGCIVPSHAPSFSTPTLPASGVAWTNTNLFDVDVYLFGAASQVALNAGGGAINLGAISGTQFASLSVPSKWSVTMTYSGAFSWLVIPRSTF